MNESIRPITAEEIEALGKAAAQHWHATGKSRPHDFTPGTEEHRLFSRGYEVEFHRLARRQQEQAA